MKPMDLDEMLQNFRTEDYEDPLDALLYEFFPKVNDKIYSNNPKMHAICQARIEYMRNSTECKEYLLHKILNLPMKPR